MEIRVGTTINVTELDKKFVVFKRVKKRNWYYRGRVVTTRHARRAILFSTLEEAQTKAKELNVGRKAYRFKAETAAKHFCNMWRVALDQWRGEVTVRNEFIAFNDVMDKKIHVNSSLNSQKEQLLKTVAERLTAFDRDVVQADMNYKNELEQAAKRLNDRKKQIADSVVNMLNAKGYIEQTDFDKDFIEKYQTDLDKKAIILYGKKDV